MKKPIGLILSIVTSSIILSCATIPKGVVAIEKFESQKYLGKWYEIARLDFVFERDLINTTAEYSINKDGSIGVVNRGFNWKAKKWKEARGKAKFRSTEDIGALEVSFFGPFYAAYNIVALDEKYKYALIMGKNLKYMWILSRGKTIPDEMKEKYIDIAKRTGFKIEDLIWVKQE